MFTISTYIEKTKDKGFGVFAKEFIPKDTIIWEFIEGLDIKIHKDTLEKLNTIQKNFIDVYFWREGDYFYSSCDHSVFQNHSSIPNSITSGSLYMVASEDIRPGEEITVNYSHFDDSYSEYAHTFIQ
jgi:SET domain-containing protein